LGTCRGGDVKLFAALGAWLGPMLAVVVLAGTIAVVAVSAVVRAVWRVLHDGPPATDASRLTAAEKEEARRRRQRMVYSPALALATAVLLLWFFRHDLGLAAARDTQNAQLPMAPVKQTVEQKG